MTKFHGHPSWDHWNVTLWISNDEGLYKQALESINSAATIDEAAQNFLDNLNKMGITETPDGAKYTKELVTYSLQDYWDEKKT